MGKHPSTRYEGKSMKKDTKRKQTRSRMNRIMEKEIRKKDKFRSMCVEDLEV